MVGTTNQSFKDVLEFLEYFLLLLVSRHIFLLLASFIRLFSKCAEPKR